MYQKDEWDTESLLDKIRKKEYTKLKEKPTHTSIFDDDAVADSAVDYLYSKDNQSKTQSFLKNSGFPSLQDRDFNKQLYGISEEQRQLRDMLKSKTNSILNAKLPTETDRAFLHGLMGEKDGEDDYQKQISDATRAKDDLLSAFRNTPFESGLKPIAPDTTAHTSVIDSPQRQAMAQSAAKSMPPSGLQNKEYDNKNFWYIDGSGNPTPPNIPSPFDKPMPSDKPKAPNNLAPASNPNTTYGPMPESKTTLSEPNALLEEHINKNYAGKKTVTIAIRRPVENSRAVGKIEEGKLDNGHAFIRIDDGQGNVQYIGYTPKDGGDLLGMVTGAYVDGKYIDNSNEDWNVAKTYVLTDAQYMNAVNYIKQVKNANAHYDYNIEKNNCVNFALNVLAHAGQSIGTMMPIEEHSWTLPDDLEEQLAGYNARPSYLSPELAALVVKSMGRYYGYTPSDAAQDLKNASGGVLLNYDGSHGLIPYNGGPNFTY